MDLRAHRPWLFGVVALATVACVEPLEPGADAGDLPQAGESASSTASHDADAAGADSSRDEPDSTLPSSNEDSFETDAPDSVDSVEMQEGGDAPPVLQITAPSDAAAFKELALGDHHGCALRNDGKVFCWGDNFRGQLGTPVDGRVSWGRGHAEAVVGLGDAVSIYADGSGTCAERQGGEMSCWGVVFLEQVGEEGGFSSDARSVPAPIEAITDIAQMAFGNAFSCARRANGDVRCWGLNHRGQLGDGTRIGRAGAESALLARALVLQGATQIASGFEHSCALTAEGRVWCWGRDLLRHSWQPRETDALSATAVDVDVDDVVEVDVGLQHVCVLQRSGEVRCWGGNNAGQLGDGSNQNSATPVLVQGLNDAVHIALEDNRSCALKASGRVACWGENYRGVLGTGTDAFGPAPGLVVDLKDAYALDVGASGTCVLSRSRGLLCWGLDGNAQNADGTAVVRDRPVPITIVD